MYKELLLSGRHSSQIARLRRTYVAYRWLNTGKVVRCLQRLSNQGPYFVLQFLVGNKIWPPHEEKRNQRWLNLKYTEYRGDISVLLF